MFDIFFNVIVNSKAGLFGKPVLTYLRSCKSSVGSPYQQKKYTYDVPTCT